MADELKSKGNDALKEGKLEDAVKYYTEAIGLDPKNHVLYSNRSAAYVKWEKYDEALADAEKCIEVDSNWSKGYSRKAAALEFLERFREAAESYQKAIELDPSNQSLKDNLSALRQKLMMQSIVGKIATHPVLHKKMEDPEFLKKLKRMSEMGGINALMSFDEDFQQTIFTALKGGMMEEDEDDSRPPSPKPKKEEKKEPEVSLTDEQKAAVEAKELGNTAYKSKKFDEAHTHYDKAFELDPTNMTYLMNKAAVFFEQGQYDECIAMCSKSVDVGRENRADFKSIAKAYARMGNCYEKKLDLKEAKRFFDKSLSEHRVPEVIKKAQKVGKDLKEQEKLAYINPELAEEEKNKGNAEFSKGSFPEALKHYTEAIHRNPEDAKLYSNRAACYSKLMEFQLALADCEKCIELDPEFIKGYLRKGACKVAMKDFNGAKTAYRKALEIDPACNEAREGLYQCVSENTDPETARKNAMNDPEVTAILSDPAMRMILNQMEDPGALKEHLKNPEIRSKLMTLIDAGLISVR